MGLSSDSKFAKKLLQALDTSNKKVKADLKLSMLDFIKIFKSDKFSEQISKIIQNDIQEEGVTKINFSHVKTMMNQTTEGKGSIRGSKNISISMKTDDKGIIEFPINPTAERSMNIYKRHITKNGVMHSKKTYKLDDSAEILVEKNCEVKSEEDIRNDLRYSPDAKHKLDKVDNKDLVNTTNNSTAVIGEKETLAMMNKTSSLTDQMKVLKKWWSEMDENKGRIELPIKTVADFMTKKGITPDRERAKNVIYKAQLGREKRQIVTIDEFNRMFCKGIFKDALVNVVESIDANNADNNDDLPLSIKISQYQRGLMMDGLMKEKSRYEDGKAILEALNILKKEEDPAYHIDEAELRAFIDDPFGKKKRERDAALKSSYFNPVARKFDDNYLNGIHIIEPPTPQEMAKSNFLSKFYSAGVDDEVNKTFYNEKVSFKNKEFDKSSGTFDWDRKDNDDDTGRARKPALVGAASKILRIVNEMANQNDIKRDKLPVVTIPGIYYSTDRQNRLGEESKILEKFQSLCNTQAMY